MNDSFEADRLLLARCRDALEISNKRSIPKFFGFLDEHERAVILKSVEKTERFVLFGGYDEAERVLFCAYPDWMDEENIPYPIVPVTVTYRKCDTLSHRDFLGVLMSFGITRESVGDILIEPARAVLFLAADISAHVLSSLQKVGGVGVKLETGFREPLPGTGELKEICDTVASARLDGVVAKLIHVSRQDCCDLIVSGNVSLNHLPCENPSKQIQAGDVISVRKKGRYIISAFSGPNRKGKLYMTAYKKI